MRGSALSQDGLGKPILAMASTTEKGVSKIAPMLKSGRVKLDALLINQPITGFVCVAINSLQVTTTIQRCRVAMVNKRRVEKDVPRVGAKIEVSQFLTSFISITFPTGVTTINQNDFAQQ